MKNVLEKSKFINSYRGAPSLRRILTKSNYSESTEVPGASKCNRPRCKCCQHIIECSETTFENGIAFQIKTTMNCISKNLIYKLKCAGCPKTYIGQTGDLLRNRATVHRQQITKREYTLLDVSDHIAGCKDAKQNFYIIPFFKLHPNATDIERETREKYFIRKFGPSLNQL